MEEVLNRIAFNLEMIGVCLALIFIVQVITLVFKDNNGGYYLRQINETLKNIITKLKYQPYKRVILRRQQDGEVCFGYVLWLQGFF